MSRLFQLRRPCVAVFVSGSRDSQLVRDGGDRRFLPAGQQVRAARRRGQHLVTESGLNHEAPGDDIVQRDASDDAAEMILDFVPELNVELLSYLDACGAGG